MTVPWTDMIPAAQSGRADAVLCGTSSTADESQQQADFATSSAESEVLSTYEKALGGVGYSAGRLRAP